MGDKLQAVIKHWEGVEQEVLLEFSRLEAVTERRRILFEEVRRKREKLKSTFDNLQGSCRKQALISGKGQVTYSVTAYLKRLEKELADLKRIYDERQGDLQRSKDRMSMAEEELLQARSERKRVENVIEKRERSEMIRRNARSEIDVEELVSARLHGRVRR